eukprot:10076.XXX_607217_606477_1 [CDS] Oithona nana genome sequencing.
MGLFGKSKPADPKELVNEWSKQLRKEGYSLDRQIRQIQRSEQAAVKSIKDAAKKGDSASAKVLAREVVHSRKAVSKIYTAKANLKSVEMQMKGQAAQVRVAGSLSKSADTMKAMQQLVKIPEIQKTMQEMSKEMMKAGIIEEMMEDTFESLEDQDELEDDVQNEVDKVISEIMAGKISKMPAAPEASIDLPEPSREELEPKEEEEPEAEEEDLEEMAQRLQALRS